MSIHTKVSMAKLRLRKNSPQILFGVGIASGIATVVVACRATLKVVKVNEAHRAEIEAANDHLKNNRYSEEVFRHHVVQTWIHSSVEYSKLYGPAFVLGVTSIACLTKSHQILTQRNAAVMAAYAGLDKMFKGYRARVVQELGIEKDTEFAHGSEVVIEKGGKGQKPLVAVKQAPADAKTAYGRWFDETNRNWDKHEGYNHTFLDNQQVWANLELKRNGHMFLNEIYDLLGMERSPAGQEVGWCYDTDCGDGYIDFGFNRYPEFVAGFERSVFLDFNVDGVIIDCLDKR